MKTNTEVHHHPNRVSVLDGGTRQVANVVREQCVDGMLPTMARALARGLAAQDRPVKLRTFDSAGKELRSRTIRSLSAKAVHGREPMPAADAAKPSESAE